MYIYNAGDKTTASRTLGERAAHTGTELANKHYFISFLFGTKHHYVSEAGPELAIFLLLRGGETECFQ